MRIVIIMHSYEPVLEWLYASTPGLERQSLAAQQAAYHATLFGSGDFYLEALRTLGHEVEEIVCNNVQAQRAWQRERDRALRADERKSLLGRLFRGPTSRDSTSGAGLEKAQFCQSSFDILLEQLRTIRPDVLYNQSVFAFDDAQLREFKTCCAVLVGEHAAAPLSPSIDYRLYDLIVSSFPPTIEWLRARGARAELNRLAFDPRVAATIREVNRDIRTSFVGSLVFVHRSRLDLLETVAAAFPDVVIHSNVSLDIPLHSPLAGIVRPPLWGRDMYALLRRSLLTLNHHGDVPAYANNMRLYEATGMGCLLITDHKQNLAEIFEPEKEVVTYRAPEECVDKIRFYRDERNAPARERIMAAGQRRTLRDHTYENSMRRLVDLIRAI